MENSHFFENSNQLQISTREEYSKIVQGKQRATKYWFGERTFQLLMRLIKVIDSQIFLKEGYFYNSSLALFRMQISTALINR